MTNAMTDDIPNDTRIALLVVLESFMPAAIRATGFDSNLIRYKLTVANKLYGDIIFVGASFPGYGPGAPVRRAFSYALRLAKATCRQASPQEVRHIVPTLLPSVEQVSVVSLSWAERLTRTSAIKNATSDAINQLSSENASLANQVESMAMRIESLAGELAKPEDVRLREVLDALEGRAVIFDGLGARVGHLLDEMDEWIERAGVAERRLKKAEEVVMMARQLTAYAWEDRLEDCEVSDSAKHDLRELSTAVWLYDQEAKS